MGEEVGKITQRWVKIPVFRTFLGDSEKWAMALVIRNVFVFNKIRIVDEFSIFPPQSGT